MQSSNVKVSANKTKTIKDWCKKGYGCPAVKFEKYTDVGFICSKMKDIKAGMEYNLNTGNITSYKIKTIRKERVFLKYIYDEKTGDIYGGVTVK